MTRIRTVGLCVVLVCALGAISATTAQAGEYGVCVKTEKVEKHYTGKYEDINCTKVEAEGEGKYEWEPYPGPASTKWGYTLKTGSGIFEGSIGAFVCRSGSGTGRVTGTKTGLVDITYSDCGRTEDFTIEAETILIDHGEKTFGGREPNEGEVWTEYVSKEGFTGQQGFLLYEGVSVFLTGAFSGQRSEDVNKMDTKSKTALNKEVGENSLETVFSNFGGAEQRGVLVQNVLSEEKTESKIEIKT